MLYRVDQLTRWFTLSRNTELPNCQLHFVILINNRFEVILYLLNRHLYVSNSYRDPVSTEIKMPIIWEPEWLAGPNGTDFVTMRNSR